MKSSLRTEFKNRLALLPKDAIQKCSANITKQLLDSPYYQESSRIAIYLSLPEEVQTFGIISDIFNKQKQCFIPRYSKTGMSMVKLHSMEDLENLPMTKWNIKQPSLAEEREDALSKGGVDLVVVPGLGFTKNGLRLGRGKGYYDKYLLDLKAYRTVKNLKPAITVGLAFNDQIVESLPTSDHDFVIDHVLFPK